MKIGVIGSGAMGSGIAQIAAQAGHDVVLCDTKKEALDKSQISLASTFNKLVEKGKMSPEESSVVLSRISFSNDTKDFIGASLVIEAIVENIDIKKQVFAQIETIVDEQCLLASNTSSLSITAIASACKIPSRVLGIHFFNPVPLMPLAEIIPALQTDSMVLKHARSIIDSWGKVTVVCRDTPGFIVNRVARPFYSESLRIYDEGIADFATIDQSMKDLGFRMGPFELMDLIGNDVNYAVTESVFASFYYDPRYKPSITQKKLTEAGWLGRKSGRGYYSYHDGAVKPEPSNNHALKKMIGERVLTMLVNEAYDALYLNVASADDLDQAMTKGVNYPKGLIAWGKELGIDNVCNQMEELYNNYNEDRYRLSPILRQLRDSNS